MSRSARSAPTTNVEERLDLRSDGPFAVGAALWLRGPGQLVATAVVKATYALDHELSALLDEPDPVQTEDDHWDDDDRKSVHVPSDLALMKPQSEVVVVGHAHAPKERPTQSIMVRVAVGSVDKIVETATSRRYTREGAVEQSAASHRMSLRYELAPGGPDTENPVGIDPSLFDEGSQRWRVPQVLPANHLVEPGEYIQKIGVGPISPTWPGRATLLRPEDRAWLADPTARPIPVGFDPRFFCVAPADQRMSEPFRADERILLEGLHPQHPRLVTNLAGVAPVLSSPGGAPLPQLVADTIYIDSDRGVVTMTFRAHIPLEEGRAPLRVRVRAGGGASAGRSFSVPAAAHPSGESTIELGRAGGSVSDALNTTNVELDPEVARSIVLPFASASQRNPQTSHHDDGALPFRAAGQPAPSQRRTPVPPPMSQAQMPASVPAMAPPLAVSPMAVPPMAAPPPMAPPPPPSRASVSPAPPSVMPPAAVPSMALVPPATPSAVSQPPPPPPPPAPIRGQTVGEQAANNSVPALARDASLPRPPPSMGGSMGGGSMGSMGGSMGSMGSMGGGSMSGSSMSSSSSRDGDPFSAAFGGKSANARPATSSPGGGSSNVPAPKPSTTGLGGGAPLGATLANLVPGGSVQSAKSASDQAADRERPRRALEEESRAESGAVRRALVDLLSFSPEVPRRIRRTKWMTALLSDFSPPRPFRRPDEPEPDREKDREERGRFEVLRVLSCGQPLDTSQLNMAVDRALEDANDLEMPLFLVAGELKPTYDEVEMLKAAVRVAQPLSNNDKRFAATIAVATEAANASAPPSNETAAAMSRQIEAALRELSLPPRYLAENVERILLEGRAYKKRTVLGEQRIRCDLSLGGSPAWPTYLPEATGAHLPMLTSFSVVALVEVRPREDASEVHTDALVVTALGRVVRNARR